MDYLKQTYRPLSVILYGSYANGTNDETSDFDALVISRDCGPFHDTSWINETPLDVFVYPASFFEGDYDPNDFIQIFDGTILQDQDGLGESLQTKVRTYLQDRPKRSQAELDAAVDWCFKMLARAKRCDAEGLFRWHWVLTESLEIFCDIMQHPYWGPKKSLQWMKKCHPTAFTCYQSALTEFDISHLEAWIICLQTASKAL